MTTRTMRSAAGLGLGLLLGGLAGCASSPPLDLELAEVPSAEELYRQGNQHLEGRRRFLFLHTTDYSKAVEAFQDVIDNYPYSEYAVLSELTIADAYFDQELYEEALTY